MAYRFNDRDRFNDREREEQNYFPPKDRERFRYERQQIRPQDWREIAGQEDMDWYQTSAPQYSPQYVRGQEGRFENRGSDFEGSRFMGRQERFSNQELNRGFGPSVQHQYGSRYEQPWEDAEASRWGLHESRGFENPLYGEYDRRYQQGQQKFRQTPSFDQRQQFDEVQENWKSTGRQQQFFGRQSTVGQFAGRGPKGYHRSDDRILEDINERLTLDPDIDASEIEVVVSSGEVILQGTVDDRETKRRAEDIAESISGVNDIQNQIRIKHRNQEGFKSGQTIGKDKGTSNKDK